MLVSEIEIPFLSVIKPGIGDWEEVQMKSKIKNHDLISSCEEYMNRRRFADAGKCYEMVAAAVEDKGEMAELLKRAAQA